MIGSMFRSSDFEKLCLYRLGSSACNNNANKNNFLIFLLVPFVRSFIHLFRSFLAWHLMRMGKGRKKQKGKEKQHPIINFELFCTNYNISAKEWFSVSFFFYSSGKHSQTNEQSRIAWYCVRKAGRSIAWAHGTSDISIRLKAKA